MATFKELDSKRSSITKEIKDCLMELNDVSHHYLLSSYILTINR